MIRRMIRVCSPVLPVAIGLTAASLWAAPLTEGNGVSNVVATPRVTSQLIAERQSIAPGRSVTVALDQKIIEHWHTYWINPGETGLPTKIKWTLPEGWTAGPIRWPTPEKLMVGPIVNFGYEGEVRLLSDLRAPANAQPGEAATIVADVTWLVCQDICIPERAKLTFRLGVDATPGAAVPGASAIFMAANSALPRKSGVDVTFVQNAKGSELTWHAERNVQQAAFFPESNEMLAANAGQKLVKDSIGYHLIFTQAPQVKGGALRGILSLDGQGLAIETAPVAAAVVSPDVRANPSPADAASPLQSETTEVASPHNTDEAQKGLPPAAETDSSGDSGIATMSLWQAAALAMLGGMILNLMPCVFPVLSMKAFALANHGRAHARAHGLAYATGVVLCFLAIAGILLALRAAGNQIGWGFQLQSPLVVTILAYVMLVLGLSMSGVFMLGTSIMGVGSSLAGREGLPGSFFTGVLATVVAAPCTAPFMGAAVGYALLQSWWVALVVFAALGAGMALPFVLLTCFDALLKRIPAPGMWMERLKQLLAFPLYATAAWLLWVLAIQAGPSGLAIAFAGCLLIALAAYLHGQQFRGAGKTIGKGVAVAATAAAIALPIFYKPAAMASEKVDVARAPEFSEQAIASELAAGRPVFVDFTAAWCITCLANERTALSREAVQAAMKRKNVTFMTADWTNQDSAITTMLQKFGRFGVPLYLLYSPDRPNKPEILPQLLTQNIVLKHLDRLPDKNRNAAFRYFLGRAKAI